MLSFHNSIITIKKASEISSHLKTAAFKYCDFFSFEKQKTKNHAIFQTFLTHYDHNLMINARFLRDISFDESISKTFPGETVARRQYESSNCINNTMMHQHAFLWLSEHH